MLLVSLFPHPDHRGIFSGGDDSGAGEEGAGFSPSVMESRPHWAISSVLDDDNKAGGGTWSSYRYIDQRRAYRNRDEEQSDVMRVCRCCKMRFAAGDS